jgi:hypothetical protein
VDAKGLPQNVETLMPAIAFPLKNGTVAHLAFSSAFLKSG